MNRRELFKSGLAAFGAKIGSGLDTCLIGHDWTEWEDEDAGMYGAITVVKRKCRRCGKYEVDTKGR
jgi:hypothetical protein